MKPKTLVLALAATFASGVLAAEPPAQAVPQSPEKWAQSLWDFTRNPNALKDPKQFVPFATAATEPAFYTALGMQMLDPSWWGFMANSMMNPATYSAWMPLMTDPNVYMKWLGASLDPNFYTALLTQFSDPGKLMRWIMAPLDPRFMNLMLQTLNPAMYIKWMASPLDPQWLRAGVSTMNPGTYLGWMGAGLNPGSYGDLWKGFMTYPVGGLPAPVSAASGTPSPYGVPLFNPLDPNAWSQLLQFPLPQPVQPVPAVPAR